MIPDFYNTIGEQGEELENSRNNAKSQEEKILHFFRFQHRYSYLTPFEVQYYVMPSVPITSVRRAMTNLTKKGYLRKMATQKRERWGKYNYTWRLNEDR